MRYLRISLVNVMLLLVVGLAGCEANGPRFTEITPSNDKAVIYVYRHGGYAGSGVKFNIDVDGERVGGLKTNGYLYKVVEPGDHLVSCKTESESAVQVNAVAGQSYYIESEIAMGLFVGRPVLKMVDPTVGRANVGGKKYSGKQADDKT